MTTRLSLSLCALSTQQSEPVRLQKFYAEAVSLAELAARVPTSVLLDAMGLSPSVPCSAERWEPDRHQRHGLRGFMLRRGRRWESAVCGLELDGNWGGRVRSGRPVTILSQLSPSSRVSPSPPSHTHPAPRFLVDPLRRPTSTRSLPCAIPPLTMSSTSSSGRPGVHAWTRPLTFLSLSVPPLSFELASRNSCPGSHRDVNDLCLPGECFPRQADVVLVRSRFGSRRVSTQVQLLTEDDRSSPSPADSPSRKRIDLPSPDLPPHPQPFCPSLLSNGPLPPAMPFRRPTTLALDLPPSRPPSLTPPTAPLPSELSKTACGRHEHEHRSRS